MARIKFKKIEQIIEEDANNVIQYVKTELHHVEEEIDKEFIFVANVIAKLNAKEAIKILQRLLHIKETGILDEDTKSAYDQTSEKQSLKNDFKNLL